LPILLLERYESRTQAASAEATVASSRRIERVSRNLRDQCPAGLFKKCDDLLAANAGIVLEKVLDRIPALEEVAGVCAAQSRWEFLLVIAPWRMTGATSSPVNPIAIF
jgi:hypothetical protein